MIGRLLGAAAGLTALAAGALLAWGASLPATHAAAGEADVAAPPQRVFARIADPAAYPRWRNGVKSVRLVDAARWTETAAQGTVPFRFGARSAPATLETMVESSSLPFSGTWTFELRPTAAGTRVRITERASISSPPLRALAPLFAPPERTLRRYLDGLEASFAARE